MGLIGGYPAYWFLKTCYPGGANVPMSSGNAYAERSQDKLSVLFGPSVYDEMRDRVVLDFGCGLGEQAVELARRGCKRVIGIDILERYLREARELACREGVDDRVESVTKVEEPVDVILSTDAFEHFRDPAAILDQMSRLLGPGGYALVEFGPIWGHPLGGHLFSVFPWAHFVFTEKALIRWRTDFKTDGATRFHEVEGGLNQMTLRRWEKLVEQSPLKLLTYDVVPIKAARKYHSKLTRELLTSTVRARLVPKDSPLRAEDFAAD